MPADRLARRRLIAGLAALAALRAAAAAAHSYRHGGIEIGHAWAPPGQAATEVRVALINAGPAADRLTGATSPAAAATALRDAAGAPLAALELPPGRGANLRPGGPHIALERLVRPLATGARIPLVLDFAVAGALEIEVWIEPAPYAAPG